jgi:hypothetical protein
MNVHERAAIEARKRSEKCRDWLKALMVPGQPKPATKEELFAWAKENLGVNRKNFDAGWDWAILDMDRKDWYKPLPRRRSNACSSVG